MCTTTVQYSEYYRTRPRRMFSCFPPNFRSVVFMCGLQTAELTGTVHRLYVFADFCHTRSNKNFADVIVYVLSSLVGNVIQL